ncbi:WXG100 family type VII secretion target [Butyrivibrio sp. MC2021]|uniref:WXG100 family type VII secretion target n=1 Tax=Butyrivibrio sp. MC2021 TaxID=1408306 RepID=UPI00047B0EB0|nr:WXG100 family type VII secretion target [Butyrivibrio sp. MC2021]
MAEIYVQSSQALQDIIDQLTKLNATYQGYTQDIDTEVKNLTTKWEGKASETFQDTYSKERHCYADFFDGVGTYIKALTEILAKYEATETANISIASK